MSLRGYLAAIARHRFSVEALRRPATLCIGNQAADADSIISSVALACHLHQDQAVAGPSASVAVWPVVQCSRKDLAIRPDTLAVLRAAALDPGKDLGGVLFADDLDLDAICSHERAGNLSIVLVDHNELLCASSAACQARVTDILDHHRDAGAHSETVTPSRRLVSFDADNEHRGVGSTCSLVAARILGGLQKGEASAAGVPVFGLPGWRFDAAAAAACPAAGAREDPALLTALLAVILIDTVDLSSAAGKVTPFDAAVAAALRQQAKVLGSAAPGDLGSTVGAAKFDPAFWAQVAAPGLLRADYKRFVFDGLAVGASSVLVSLPHFLDQLKAHPRAIADWMESERVDWFVLLCCTKGDPPSTTAAAAGATAAAGGEGGAGGLRRKGLIVARGTALPAATATWAAMQEADVLKAARHSETGPLQPSDLCLADAESLVVPFAQGQPRGSRKALGSLISRVVAQVHASKED